MTTNQNASASDKTNALLGAYGAGTLTPAMHAMVAAHLELCPRNRSFVRALDGMKGLELVNDIAAPLTSRDVMLAAILKAPAKMEAASKRDEVLPSALHKLIGKDFSQIKWRSRLPGVREYHIAGEAGGQAVLYWIKAGRKMPFHTHDGSEATLVLKGAFHDASGTYCRGDLAVADADVDHQPIVDAGEDCICFAVTDAPLRLTGPVGRIIEKLFGHRH